MKCKANVKYVNEIYYIKKSATAPSNTQKKYSYETASIDLLPLRHHVKKEKLLITGLHSATRSKHIHGADLYDKSRQLSAINRIQLAPKKQRADYVKIGNDKILLNKYIKTLKATRTQFILDNQINKKLYVNGNQYDIINTIA